MAKDIVEIFEDYAAANEFHYEYGNKNVLNLLQVTDAITPDKVYFLAESVTRDPEIGQMGLSRNAQIFSGNYILAYHDDYATHVYSENDTQVSKSKYKTKIKPLLTIWKELESQLIACKGYDVLSHRCIDAINLLNANLTGLFCTYRIRVYEN